jgi:hypothetical protein
MTHILDLASHVARWLGSEILGASLSVALYLVGVGG